MKRENRGKAPVTSKPRRSKTSKPARARARAAILPPTAQALRIQAQIAMLKRALLAAEDDGLPHKAVCDYLQTLSQMAKVEASGAIEPSDRRQAEANANGDSTPVDATPVAEATQQAEDVKRLLRRTIADIYGLSDNEPVEPDPSGATQADGSNATV